MAVYIIYHNRDNDGFCAGYIASLKFPDATLIGYHYGESMQEIDAIPDRSTVFMLDVSLPTLRDMLNLCRRTSMTWIDHHEKVNREFSPYLAECEIIYGKISACRLAWAYFFPDKKEPFYVELTGRYDVFDKSNLFEWQELILPFEYGLRSIGIKTATEYGIISKRDNDDIIENGKPIVFYLQNTTDKMAERAAIVQFEGLKGMVTTGETGDFWYSTPRFLNEKPDVLFFIHFDVINRIWKMSLRQGANIPVNCADIAARYGGGGHFDAAGCVVKDLPF